MKYMFRRPQYPVIVVVDDRAFRALAPHQFGRLLQRELECIPGTVRLLDSAWRWFDVLIKEEVIVPSFLDGQPPSKKTLIALVNSRANRAPADPMYDARSLSNRSRERVFAELLAVLPAK